MRVSEQWLRSWVNPSENTDEIVSLVTFAGLEVDSVDSPCKAFDDVVVARIESIEPHPDADKLRVCQVNDGSQMHQVVCGAANAAAGLVAPLARVGATLEAGFKIKKAKLRGVESHGMLCGADELGLSEVRDGLMELPADAPLGQNLREYLDLNDAIIEIDLTPNRGDCFGLRGIAREVGVLTRTQVNEPEVPKVSPTSEDSLSVELVDAQGCPRYLGRVISGVDLSKPSPAWLVERLRRAGVRAIDPAVDVTNYVMLELGQPMHAFDKAQIEGGIRVRRAQEGESLTLLDGKVIELDADVLVIADHAKPLALAGIMGGEHSGVADSTQDLFLEVAWFNPLTIAGRARRFGLHTDASHRYERGVDSQLQAMAMERATQLLLDIVGGQAGPVTVAESADQLPAARQVELRTDRLQAQLDLALPADQVTDILERLGLDPEFDGVTWRCTVPSWRHDISIEQDLVEEIARVYGYDNLPSKMPAATNGMPRLDESVRDKNRLRSQLVDLGLNEVITYSFVNPALHNRFHSTDQVMDLANPITADMVRMRQSMVPGLTQAASYNLNRQHKGIAIFEVGQCFVAEGDTLTQNDRVGVLMSGETTQWDWQQSARVCDFYDMKGVVEALLSEAQAPVSFVPAQRQGMHPGQTAEVYVGDECVGVIGALHPETAEQLDLPLATFVADLSLQGVVQGSVASFKPLSKFPASGRDLALLVRDQSWGEIQRCIAKAAGQKLDRVVLFDVYRGQGLPEGHASLAVNLSWRDQDGTIEDAEINAAVDSVLVALDSELGVILR